MKKRKRKAKFTKNERIIYTSGCLCLIALFVCKIFFGAQVSNLKMNIEKINYKIDSQDKKNESLMMQVNELTSYENVESVIRDMGLAYNNENIIVIND